MNKVTFLAALFASAQAFGQAAFPPPPPKVSPAIGVIDMHTHTHPDVFGRNMDDIDLANLAKARGMRGFVLKNHISETASRAALTMKEALAFGANPGTIFIGLRDGAPYFGMGIAQGAAEKPHPRDGGRADQDRRRAAFARGAAPDRGARHV